MCNFDSVSARLVTAFLIDLMFLHTPGAGAAWFVEVLERVHGLQNDVQLLWRELGQKVVYLYEFQREA